MSKSSMKNERSGKSLSSDKRSFTAKSGAAQSSTSQSDEEQAKDIIVSIVLTESTSSLLKLDLPHLENTSIANGGSPVCAIKAERNFERTNCSDHCGCNVKNAHKFWFSGVDNPNDQKHADCQRVSSEVAYFSTSINMANSSSSLLQPPEDYRNKEKPLDLSSASSSSSIDQKLKPTKVYTRPLYTVRSVAHEDCIKSQANDIYISVVNSKTNSTDSDWVNVCRICHGGKSIGDLCAPCRCRGSIAMAHLECLERWLKESANSHCELCQHHYKIVREPKYSVLASVFMFLRHPGDHFWELFYDLCAFAVYTPAAMVSTYMLMMLCESAAKHTMHNEKNISAHVMAITAVFGLAAIDFTYSAWLMTNLQKHAAVWRNWYRNNCELRLILSENKSLQDSSTSIFHQQD